MKKLAQHFNHNTPSKPADAPYKVPPHIFGTEAQIPIPIDTTPKLDNTDKLCIQKILGICLYYGQASDDTILPGLSAIASEQSTPIEKTKKNVNQILDYLTTHPDVKVHFYAWDTILNVYSNASFLLESRVQSCMSGYFFMGSTPVNRQPIKMNNNIFSTVEF